MFEIVVITLNAHAGAFMQDEDSIDDIAHLSFFLLTNSLL